MKSGSKQASLCPMGRSIGRARAKCPVQLPPADASAAIVSHFAPTASVDRSAAVNATAPDRDTAAIDTTAIVPSCAWRIGIVAAGLPIAASRPIIYPATNHTSPIDGAASIDPAAAVNTPSSIDGSTPVNASPASDCRHQRIRFGGIGDGRMRLHDRGDGLRWLRNKQCSCRCDCKRTRPQKSVHLQLLAHAGGRFGSH